MKKIITILIGVIISVTSYGQLLAPKGIIVGTGNNQKTLSVAELGTLDGIPTASSIATQIGLKIAIADTSSMLSKYAHKKSPTFTGVPIAPTATAGTNTTQIATTAFVLANSGSGEVTLAGVETLTNKTLTSPKINENVVLTPTSTELNYVDGVTSSIQGQLNGKLPYAETEDIDDIIGDLSVGNISKLQFIIDTTDGTPVTGDSILSFDSFIDKHIEVYRGANGSSLSKQYRNPTGALQIYHNGYRFQKSSGTLVFKPVFTTNEHIAIEVTDSTNWTVLTLPYYPSYDVLLADGNTVAWYDAQDLTNITKDAGTGAVSLWKDKLLSGHDLYQNTNTVYPIWSTNGILFDGVNDYMLTNDFTFNQPLTVYLVLKQVTWTNYDGIMDGHAANHMQLVQTESTPDLEIYGGSSYSTVNNNLALNTLGIIRIIFDGSTSKFQVNETTAITGSYGTSHAGGITFGKVGSFYGNFQIQEAIFRKVHDSSVNETLIYDYLKAKYGL